MSGDINWKSKYTELKSKYMESVDMAFRLGFEEGSKSASQDQAMMQQQQNAAAMPGGANGGQSPDTTQANGPSQPGDETSAPMPGGATPKEAPQPAVPMAESEHPDGSELDQHIAKLESMLKSETPPNPADLILLTEQIRGAQKKMSEKVKFDREMKKSQDAIPGIIKALHKPAYKIGVQAQHNLSSNAKNAVSMQEKIVTDIMQKWEQEENQAGKDIMAVLGVQSLTKKE